MQSITIIAFGFLVLYLLRDARFFLYAAIGLLGVVVFIPSFANRIESWWMRFAHILGRVNSRILLSIIFYVFLIPLALLRRLVTRSSTDRRGVTATNFVSRDHRYTDRDLINTW